MYVECNRGEHFISKYTYIYICMYLHWSLYDCLYERQINEETTLLIIGPEELRRKRQRIEGDSLHTSLQQPQKKIQSDHAGGRKLIFFTILSKKATFQSLYIHIHMYTNMNSCVS